MKTYCIYGHIVWYKYCCGHVKSREVNVKVCAENEDEAKLLMLDKVGLIRGNYYDFDDLKFDELTDDESLRLAILEEKRRLGPAIAPPLFDVEMAA